MTSVLVVGAGLSGLAMAWSLSERGRAVEVVDAGNEPGGLIRTRHTPEGIVETAANGFVRSETMTRLCAAIGVEVVPAREESRRRYIFRDQRPRRWPLSPIESGRTAARVAGAIAMRAAGPRAGETVEQWGRRVAGAAAAEWLIAPALAGVYAAPIDRLSARAVFGRRRRRRARLAAPRSGMGEIAARLCERLRARGVRIESGVTVRDLSPSQRTVLAVPPPAAAALCRHAAPEFARAVASIEMAPLVSVTAFFAPHTADVRGFGILFPRGQRVGALGVLFNAEIFPDRSAMRSETWITGGLDVVTLAEETIVANVLADREVLTGRRDAPAAAYVSRSPQAIPIYDAAVPGAARAISTLPGWLDAVGNYLGAIGVSSLIENADTLAVRSF